MTTLILPTAVPALPLLRTRVAPPSPPHRPIARRALNCAEDVPDVVFQLVRALIECLSGHRPVHQVVRFVSATAAARLAQATASGMLRRAKVGSVRAQAPRPGAVEVTIRLVTGSRSLACAIRIERKSTRWVCTDLQV